MQPRVASRNEAQPTAAPAGRISRIRHILVTERHSTEPVRENVMRSTERADSPEANPGAASETPGILVVDDEQAVRGVVVRLLRRRGYDAMDAPDAETALSVLGTEARRLRLVITDDRMPGMSGQELAAVIARIYPHLRVLLITGVAGGSVRDADQGGIIRVLPKPFTSEGLLGAVTELMS